MPRKRRRVCRPCSRPFTTAEAKTIARKLGISTRSTPIGEIVRGLNEEREHGDITCCDGILTGRIVKVHVSGDPRYYRRGR